MTTKMDEDQQSRAMDILSALRRRLVERATRAVLDRENALLKQVDRAQSPLKFGREIGVAVASLNRVDRVIAALGGPQAADGKLAEAPTTPRASVEEAAKRTFDHFASLVSAVKIEEAARELSRIFQMPLERAGTATRFFARAIRARPELAESLANLHRLLADQPASLGLRQLMMIFGFQAVESQMAMKALRTRQTRLIAT